ncbi:Tyrosinase [Ophiocordyceps camponoti-floridani]|uniref:tyrosinase n=1 Tax=Ophiocordyceps camponoti-floridani TaxID=2030778 RepID=A0A8H4VEK6_9HYPO|nr:Tyrosinase [Ophiocordyceps camponoti-floridani]
MSSNTQNPPATAPLAPQPPTKPPSVQDPAQKPTAAKQPPTKHVKPSPETPSKDPNGIPIRKDIRTLSQQEKDNLVRAFDAIQKLPADDEDSFYQIAGYHGEPFRGAGYSNAQWWGGYCNHGNILFPTWHRAYLWRLEAALQRQVPGVMLPYWNEIDDETTKGSGVPEIFLAETYKFADGKTIPNPLRSYTYQKTIVDRLVTQPDTDYTKPKGTKTCRFPYSSLYGEADIQATNAHNALMDSLGVATTNKYLSNNVKAWLNDASPGAAPLTGRGAGAEAGVKGQFLRCLRVPNYVVFSNVTSSARWNDDNVDTPGFVPVVSLETPHNAIHVAIGGVQVPGPDMVTVPEARGDMGENETASFDPVFYFHHCFVDLVFWQWQLLHGQSEELIVEPQLATYPGTNSVDAQGPTPGVQGNIWLTLDSPLDPFKNPEDQSKPMTSRDLVDIRQLGYTYQLPGQQAGEPQKKPEMPAKIPLCPQLVISGINRSSISGSFSISAWTSEGEAKLVGLEPILSRWHVTGCANCQAHLEVRAHLPLEGWTNEEAEKAKFKVLIHTRDHPEGLTEIGGKVPKWEVVASRPKPA